MSVRFGKPECFTKLVAIVRSKDDASVTFSETLQDRVQVARDGLSIVMEINGRGGNDCHVQVGGGLWLVYCTRRGFENDDRLCTPSDEEHESESSEDVFIYHPFSDRSYEHLGRELLYLIELQRECYI
jgi:hypothetical protein